MSTPAPALTPYDLTLATPVGSLGLRLGPAGVCAIDFLTSALPVPQPAPAAGLAGEAARQLARYFREPRAGFSLPLALEGTAFQRRVWEALRAIPPGQTLTYGALARRLGSSARAVGGACRANPVPLIVPCHRVVAAGGLGGFGGATSGPRTRLKRWLLAHERGG